MGNYHTRSVRFCQSQNDFPLLVSLGDKMPSFGLSRWKENNSLRFVPSDDEGFAVHGNKKQLFYKGRRRSHRFTIHDDFNFEYDCILLKEPESNVVSLRMVGAENFDFFKQPDFVPDPVLKGSYAVYRKETLIGQGTGKLCHIHRPLIIDARGRNVWGELSVIGNDLHITIPEQWLSEAKYPVVVDPTVGTSTVGSQNMWVQEAGEDPNPLMFELNIPVNRFTVPSAINGQCTAFFYVNQDDLEAGGRPVIYSDSNNRPLNRYSANENFVNLRVTSSNPKGWRSATFNSNGSIASGSNIWFGLFCEYYWMPRFDYGSVCWGNWWWENYGDPEIIPNVYPNYQWNISHNFKLSMYFTYISAQNYVLTLTQGVNLSDTGKINAEYRRTAALTARITDVQNLKAEYKREATENVNGTAAVNALFSFFRQCVEAVGNSSGLTRLPVFNRFITDEITTTGDMQNNRGINIRCNDSAVIADTTNRSQGFLRGITESITIADDFNFQVLFIRTLYETQGMTDAFKQVRNYIRCLYVEAGNMAETVCRGNSCRNINDTVQAEGTALRHLLIFVKILTASLVRDFFIRRFLIAREELVLKSCITREITLESKIN